MGIIGTDTSATANRPLATATPEPGSVVHIDWTKAGYDGVIVEINALTKLSGRTTGTDMQSPYIDTRDPLHPGARGTTLWAAVMLRLMCLRAITTFGVTDFVTGVTDSCDTTLGIGSVVIEKVTSDEIENGNGDGNTLNDIVIAADCKSVQLRSEREGGG